MDADPTLATTEPQSPTDHEPKVALRRLPAKARPQPLVKCSAKGCDDLTYGTTAFCLVHWREVPSTIQKRLWHAQQTADKSGHRAALVQAVDAIAHHISRAARKALS